MTVLGVVLIVLGVSFVILGFVAAAQEVFRSAKPGKQSLGSSLDPEKWAKLLTALTELVKVAPQWFLLVLVGLAMLGAGSAMIS